MKVDGSRAATWHQMSECQWLTMTLWTFELSQTGKWQWAVIIWVSDTMVMHSVGCNINNSFSWSGYWPRLKATCASPSSSLCNWIWNCLRSKAHQSVAHRVNSSNQSFALYCISFFSTSSFTYQDWHHIPILSFTGLSSSSQTDYYLQLYLLKLHPEDKQHSSSSWVKELNWGHQSLLAIVACRQRKQDTSHRDLHYPQESGQISAGIDELNESDWPIGCARWTIGRNS